jgi:protein SCO1/2
VLKAKSLTRLMIGIMLTAAPAFAQAYNAEQPLGASAQQTPAYLRNSGITQNLNGALPLHDLYTDETGKQLDLATFFGPRPVMMAMVYYKCAMLCPQVLHGMAVALGQSGFQAGDQYEVVVTSIDPTDTPADAAQAKQKFLATLGPSATGAQHIHFLTGSEQSITDLAQATGFHYVQVPGPDGRMTQYAHSSVIMVATPDGRMSKYLSGVDYPSRDIRLALVEAGGHKIGSLTDMVLLYCCSYVPSEGRYTVTVLHVLALAAIAALASMALMFYLLAKKPRHTA